MGLNQKPRGKKVLLMSGITATTTSSNQKANGHNAIRIDFRITVGSGTWTIKIQNKSVTGAYIDAYDHNGNQMYINGATADKSQVFLYLADDFRIVATEDGDGATVSVSYQVFSV
jgi:hypothetical protein